jgi:GTP-binding protein EngB required for normal cell division
MEKCYVIFTGRPNAGKSTVIRVLTGLKIPAGKRPGTTKRINEYPMSPGLFLMDMPGYGRIVGETRRVEDLTKNTILDFIDDHKKEIGLAVHIINISTFIETERRLSRKGYTSLDVEMVDYLFHIIGKFPIVVANKIDKGTEHEILDNLKTFIERVRQTSSIDIHERVYPISAKTGVGIGVLKKRFIEELVSAGFNNPLEYMR